MTLQLKTKEKEAEIETRNGAVTAVAAAALLLQAASVLPGLPPATADVTLFGRTWHTADTVAETLAVAAARRRRGRFRFPVASAAPHRIAASEGERET